MLDSIQLAMSGMQGFASGLRVIANNTANLATPGFKGATPQFAEQFPAGGMQDQSGTGGGLVTYPAVLDWRAGELRGTGNPLDLAVDGAGLFVLRGEQGLLRYTRSGQFEFDASDRLVNRADQSAVLQRDAGGALLEVSLSGLRSNPAEATKTIRFSGNLSSTATEHTIAPVSFLDAAGTSHALTLIASNVVDPATGAADGHAWRIKARDESGQDLDLSGKDTLAFANGLADASSTRISVQTRPAQGAPLLLQLDFGSNVTSFAAGSTSTLAVASSDGRAAGTLSAVTFDPQGVLTLTYSNGQTARGARLALASFLSPQSVRIVGTNQFEATGHQPWQQGAAGEGAFGVVRAGSIEISNVDLSAEFSELVVIQRGYQSAAQILSTSNEMLQQLLTNTRGK